MPGRQTHAGADLRRAGAVVLLVAIAVIGLRAGGAFPATSSPGLLRAGGRVLYWAVIVTGAALVLLDLAVVTAWLLWGRKGGPRLLPKRRRRSPFWALATVAELVALAWLIQALQRRGAALRRAQVTGSHTGARPPAGHLFLPPGSAWPLLLGLALAAAAAFALLVPARRARLPAAAPGPAPEEPAPLRAALAAGAGALAAGSDPRAAIVNCYAAMERSLAAAGSPPEAADTPAEVLTRATAGGLVRSAAAGTLTGLFRRARYSTHLITEADRIAASRALGRLQADLGGPP